MERKLGNENNSQEFHLKVEFECLSSDFLVSLDPENMVTLVFSGFSLTLHLPYITAKFRRFFCERTAVKHTFLLIARNAASSGSWNFEFWLWLGFRIDLVGHETIHVDSYYMTN